MADDDPDDKVYDYDGIQMDTADHVWIDHNTITRINDGLHRQPQGHHAT